MRCKQEVATTQRASGQRQEVLVIGTWKLGREPPAEQTSSLEEQPYSFGAADSGPCKGQTQRRV